MISFSKKTFSNYFSNNFHGGFSKSRIKLTMRWKVSIRFTGIDCRLKQERSTAARAERLVVRFADFHKCLKIPKNPRFYVRRIVVRSLHFLSFTRDGASFFVLWRCQITY